MQAQQEHRHKGTVLPAAPAGPPSKSQGEEEEKSVPCVSDTVLARAKKATKGVLTKCVRWPFKGANKTQALTGESRTVGAYSGLIYYICFLFGFLADETGSNRGT